MPIRMEDTHVELVESGVRPEEQTMTIEKPFWAFFTTNMVIAVWLVGIFIAGFGLNLWQSVIVIVLGNVLGSIPLGLIAEMGPRTRLSQVEGSRLSLGKMGTRVSAILNWIDAVGWDAINNIPSAAALVALLVIYGFTLPFWLALAFIVVLQMLIGIYGHHLVQIVAKYVGWLFFAVVIACAVGIVSRGYHSTVHEIPSLKNFIMAFSLVVAGTMSFAPYVSDYTRYLPADIPARKPFWAVLGGSVISATILECFGVLIASSVADQTPTGLVTALSSMAGVFAPAVLAIIAISAIPANAFNDNSAAYCLISAGIRLGRPVSAALGAIISFTAAAWGNGRFAETFENFLFFIFYWMAPWTAIVLVHWFMAGRHQPSHPFSRGWTIGATIFVVTTVLTVLLFSASPLCTSPIAKALNGVDIGYYVGFIIAGIWYAIALKRQLRSTAFNQEV